MGDIADYIIDTPIFSSKRRDPAKECKFCGAFPLFWLNVKGKWVLIDQQGKKHVCKNYEREDPFHGV